MDRLYVITCFMWLVTTVVATPSEGSGEEQFTSAENGVDNGVKIVSNYLELEGSGLLADQAPDSDLPPALDSVFEVYHIPRNNNEGNKSLADHIEQIFLNRFPSPAQTSEEEEEDNDVEPIQLIPRRRGDIERDDDYDEHEEEGLDQEEDEEEERPSGASLAIVFDTTGSMHDDLMQVRTGAERIMAAMLERPDKPIYNYVLVPFHDPKIGPVTVTTDHNVFREGLQRINVHGGGDCPEMAVGAIKQALEASLPNSFIYVFTDARAKDYKLLNDVLALVQRKQSKVVFVMTGDCGDQKHVGYQVFEKIASTSSGQMYNLNKTDVDKVLQFVRTSLQTRKVNLLAVNKPAGSEDKHNVYVDETLQEFTISVSGQNPQIDVTDPQGKPVQGPPQLNTVLDLQNIKAINVVEPTPGKWTVKVGSDSEHSVRSTGRSDVDFNFGFSAIVTNKMEETNHRPLKGEMNAILVMPTVKDVIHNLTTLKLVDLRGVEFQEYPLHPVRGKADLHQGPMFVPPSDYFYLCVEGFDRDGFPVKRISATAITGQSPEPPVVNMRTQVTGWLTKPVKLKCHVESLVPFHAMWFKNGSPLTPRQRYLQTSELFWMVQTPSVDAEGNYTCYASNSAGSTTRGTFLSITGPAPAVDTPPQVVSALKKQAALHCTVHSDLHYNVTWARSSLDPSMLPEPDSMQVVGNSEKTTVLSNGTLLVHDVNLDDEGWYSCIAENRGGRSEGNVFLAVKEPIHVTVTPHKFEFHRGNQICLACQASGTPEPSLLWRKDGHVLKEGNGRELKLVHEYRRLDLVIDNADTSDAGEYQCVAENEDSIDVAVATGEYLEAPTVNAEKSQVLAIIGDTVTLQCTVQGAPRPILKWYKGDREIVPSSKSQMDVSGTLVIDNAQAEDSDKYACIAENRLGKADDFVSLQVGTPPQMVHIPSNTQVDIHSDTSIPCTAVGVPIPSVTWVRRDGKELSRNVSVSQHGTLHITHAGKEDEGVYVCNVSNVFGNAQYEAHVNVTGIVRPVLQSRNDHRPDATVKRGQQLELPCHVILSNPPASIAWYKDGEILDEGQMDWEGIELMRNGSLVISYTTQEHEGTYECVASNVGGSVSQATTVHVHEPPSFPVSRGSVEMKVKAGEAVVLLCPALGDPEPLVIWRKDRMPLSLDHNIYKNSDDNSLVINSPSVADSGTYECTAVNPAGEATRAMVLFVQVPPHIQPVEESLHSVDGQMVTLSCLVSAVPTPALYWYKDEAPLSSYGEEIIYLDNNQTIRFIATFASAGLYTCEASNDAGTAKLDMTLTVLVPPSIYPPDDEIHVLNASQSVSLQCFASGYPTPEIRWEKNGVEISDDEYMSIDEDGILDISNVQANMSGVYVCDAENPAGIIQKMFYLLVHEMPVIDVDLPAQMNLIEGDDYSLLCSARGIPNPHITWRKDGRSIAALKDEHLITLQDGTLVINSAVVDTAGIYTCVAENTIGYDEHSVMLEVLVPPSMMDSGESIHDVTEGDSIILACPAMDAVPPPTIQWLKDGKALLEPSLEDSGRSLKILDVEKEDSGTYFCVATNLAGHTEAEIKLNVLSAPRFDVLNYTQENTAVAGSKVTFHCNVSGNPPPKISWKKNNVPVTPHTAPGAIISPNKLALMISNVRPHDTGHYQCSASNRAGRNDRDFHLTVLVPPDVDGPAEEIQEAVKGESVLLHCPITGTPQPHIKWTKDGLDIVFKTSSIVMSEDQRILEIPKAQPLDAGIYTCTGANQAASKQKKFNVTVYEPPVMHQQSHIDEFKVRVGDDISLTCVTRGNPKPDIKWLHNGHLVDNIVATSVSSLLDERTSVEEHTLPLYNVATSDAGKYTCLASNIVGIADKNYHVTVLAAPRLARHRGSSSVIESLEGLPVTIKCPVMGTYKFDVHWLKDSLPLDKQDSMEVEAEGQLLRIKSSRMEHTGKYTCIVQNNAGNVSNTFQLNVLAPPVMADMGDVENIKVTANKSLKLNCNVTSGFPRPNIIWYKGSLLITSDRWPHVELENYNTTLIIRKVTMKHSGRYACVATNSVGDTEITFSVDVEEPPEAPPGMEEKSSLTVQLHRRLLLKCPLTGSPQPAISWYKNGASVEKQVGSNVHVSSDGKQLHLMHALLTDAGNYSCVAENSAGAKELQFEVNVIVPVEWSSWSGWSECSVTCGPGEQYRARVCGEDSDDFVDETVCQGDAEQFQSCHMSECPIDGAWAEWSEWTSCSESCGRGTRRRYRKCSNPSPSYGGKPCIGSDGQQEYCVQSPCPVNGKWSNWSSWSTCSATCNNGTQRRHRKCNNPPPAFGGSECSGTSSDYKNCNAHKCPVDGGWSPWTEWSPCSVTCGHGSKRRYRTCSSPAPQYKGAPCSGENLQIEKCMAKSCGNVPQLASLRVKGKLNGENLLDDIIAANITDKGSRRTISAKVKDIIKKQAGWFPYLNFLLSPVSWNTAYEVDDANNGYSLTSGNFRQQSTIEFATGQQLTVRHTGQGIDEVGTLQVEIEVNGEVPLVEPEVSVQIEPFEEDYVQTGPNSLYVTSTNVLSLNGHKLPYTWNNTVSYDTYQGTMPYLVEKLMTRDIDVDYNPELQEMTYMMSTVIGRKYDKDKCPEGFTRDEQHLHCTDIDECQDRRTNRCHYTQICDNTFGSYQCLCHPGYKSRGIGKRCTGPHYSGNTNSGKFPMLKSLQPGRRRSNAYESPPQPLITVQQSWGCPDGYEPVHGVCHDIDECTNLLHLCNMEQTCLNTKGSYRCLDTPCPSGYERDTDSGNCVQFCDEPGAKCREGALLTQTISHVVLNLDYNEVQPYQDLMQLTVYGEDGRRLPHTRFRIQENETGKPFRVRIEDGRGILYALKALKLGRLYRVVVLAVSYDENEQNILYTTKYIIFINL